MSTAAQPSRRSVLVAAVTATVAGGSGAAVADGTAGAEESVDVDAAPARPVHYRAWTT